MNRSRLLSSGAEFDANGATRFRFWAPSAKRVELVARGVSGAALRTDLQAEPAGWYAATVAGLGAGTRYHYRIDDEVDVPDPASRFNPEGVTADSEVIDPRAFKWRDTAWRGRPWTEAVVYELHVGTFTEAGTFRALVPRLKDLAELGVTTLELLPLAAFPGTRGWGYDSVLPFAPHAAYGRPEDLKELVQTAHEHGLSVLLDVVYNHFGPAGNYLQRYAKQFFTDRHQTPWGDAINFEGEAGANVRRFFIENALYWIEEYGFDGLRLDAIHAIRDASPRHFVDELSQLVLEGPGKQRQIHLVLENHRNETSRLRPRYQVDVPAEQKISQWNDDIHHCLHVILTDERDGYYIDFAEQPIQQLGRALAEGFVFQGELTRFGNTEPRGEPSGELPPTAFVNFLQNHDQIGNRAFGERIAVLTDERRLRAGFAIVLLAPAIPMLFMGEEYAAPQPFLYFCDYEGELAQAITNGRRKEFEGFAAFCEQQARERIPDPNARATFEASRLHWSDRARPVHRDWLAWVKHLLRQRRAHVVPFIPSILPNVSSYTVKDDMLSVEWPGTAASLFMIANLSTNTVVADELDGAQVLFSTAREQHASEQIEPWEVRLLLRTNS